MLDNVRQQIQDEMMSDEVFDHFFLEYTKRVQDENIDLEVRSKIRFGIASLGFIDRQIEHDYRKLVDQQC